MSAGAPLAPTGMAASLRGAWRLARATLHGVHGLLMVLLAFPHLGRAAREARIGWWSGKMFHMLGMKLEISGAFRPGAKLLVANHISWLDILAVHAACPEARFVSKAEVRQWPLVSRLIDAARTLYLQRERARDALRVVHEMAQALKDGTAIRSPCSPRAPPAPAMSCCPFTPICCRRRSAPARRCSPWCCALPTPRLMSAWRRISPAISRSSRACGHWRARGMVVRVTVLEAIGTLHADRRALAERARGLIAEALNGRPGQRGV